MPQAERFWIYAIAAVLAATLLVHVVTVAQEKVKTDQYADRFFSLVEQRLVPRR